METAVNRLKRRRFLLVLPILILPFLTMTFWALGGGKGNANQDAIVKEGINTELPDAYNSNDPLDKMSLYGKVMSDEDSSTSENLEMEDTGWNEQTDEFNAYGDYSPSGGTGDSERKLRRRLEDLERVITMQEMTGNEYNYPSYGSTYPMESNASLERLELMMQRMSEPTAPDPELQVLDGMLEKIIDIQNPERAKEKLKERSEQNKGLAFPVTRTGKKQPVGYIDRDVGTKEDNNVSPESKGAINRQPGNGFYSMASSQRTDVSEIEGIPAVAAETQTLVSGATLKMRLTEDIYVNGILIPAGHFVNGECRLNGERLQVQISGIQYGNHQLPVSLTVYDRDGLEGIRVPGAITRDAAKEGSDRAIQNMQFLSLDPSIGAQAAGAGIEAAKGLFSRSARLVRVTVKAGHPVLLYDEQLNR